MAGSNKFCRFLSNGYSINLNKKLVVKPCCWYRGETPFDENLEQTRKLQLDSVTGWIPGCSVCQKQEQAGYNSFRQSSFDIIPDTDDNAIVALDINIDFNCNAACVICGPEYSSLWAKQSDKNKVIHIKSDYDAQSYLDTMLVTTDLSKLRRIKFFGGEPLLTDSHIQVLEKIPHPEQVDIWYTTNASILPTPELLNLWGKFKLVYFEASIDGIDEQFNYIRWPLRWSHIERNLLTLKATAPVNVLFRINHTLNPFNIFYYDRLEQWVHTNLATNSAGDATEINIHPCWGDWGLERTPLALREVIHEKYANQYVSTILPITMMPINTIIEFTKQWDSIRNNNWRTIFPEIVKYFD
jgi:sulfatase maturation enzyme AslB (radical SAM superfamily)